MIGEDDLDRLLRHLRDKREESVRALATGTASPENVPNGYMQLTGRIQGIEAAIDIVKDLFSSWFPQEPGRPGGTKTITDY